MRFGKSFIFGGIAFTGAVRAADPTGKTVVAPILGAVKAVEGEGSGDNCADGPGWASPVLTIGSSNTTGSVCESQYGKDYSPIQAIEVWRKGEDDDRIAGIQFTYGSGERSEIFGHEDTSKYPAATLNLEPGETIKNAILYGNGKGEWLGHIHMETSKGKTFDAGRDTDGIDPYGVEVGSGLLLGAIITAQPDDNNKDIASLAWLFMAEEIDKIVISDVNFEQDVAGSDQGIDPQNVVVGRWYNKLDTPQSYSLSPAYGVSSSYAYSQTTTTSFGGAYSVEISAEVFGIGVKEDFSFSWSVAQEDASTLATSSATSVTCGASGTLKPSTGVTVTGAYQTGKGTWTYTSKVTIHLKDGKTYSYDEKGQLANTAYNQCTTEFEPYNGTTTIKNSPGLKAVVNKRAVWGGRGPRPTPPARLPGERFKF